MTPPAVVVLLAACAGATDVLAVFGLGGAFAGNLTGNLVTAAYDLTTGRPAWTPLAAIAGVIGGEVAGDHLLRRGGPTVRPLLGELVLLTVGLAAWVATDGRPPPAAVPVLVAVLAVALGLQGAWAARFHQTTTYFTGFVFRAVDAVAAGTWSRAGTTARQIAALLVGAMLGALAVEHLRAAAALLPVVLLGAALAVQRTVTRDKAPATRHP